MFVRVGAVAKDNSISDHVHIVHHHYYVGDHSYHPDATSVQIATWQQPGCVFALVQNASPSFTDRRLQCNSFIEI